MPNMGTQWSFVSQWHDFRPKRTFNPKSFLIFAKGISQLCKNPSRNRLPSGRFASLEQVIKRYLAMNDT